MNQKEKYEKDIDDLVNTGNKLYIKLIMENKPNSVDAATGGNAKVVEIVKKEIPSFSSEYQGWYSEVHELIRQLLPSRLDDFEHYYKGDGKARKELTYANYTIKDALNGLTVTRNTGAWDEKVVVNPSAAIEPFAQQVKILQSVQRKFTSSLFDLKTLVHAEILDDEIDQARVLLKNGFLRASGAIAGVALESHLKTVCTAHGVKPKSSWSLSNYNDSLKDVAYDTAEWRRIQHLTDLRNKCDHKKSKDPTVDEISDLIDGSVRVIKNIF